MKKQISDFVSSRVPVNRAAAVTALREQIPVHLKEWIYCLGGTPMVLFMILAATGILLTFYYVPAPDHAFESVANITRHVRFGWLVRGIHRAASHLMIFTVLLHMVRVLGTRAYRKPREFTWMTGVALLLTVLGFAFSGYSLVYDQLSYWATTVGTNMIGSTPVVGHFLLNLVRGGPEVNPNTLTRFYNFHVGVLPTIMVLLVGLHILFIRLHGVSELENDPRKSTYSFFPDHILKETVIALLVLIALVNYVVFFPPQVGIPADPMITPEEIRPEWYFFPSYRWMKLVPMQVGLWGSVAFIMGMVFLPFIDQACEKFAPGRGLGRMIGVFGFLITLVFLVWEAFAG